MPINTCDEEGERGAPKGRQRQGSQQANNRTTGPALRKNFLAHYQMFLGTPPLSFQMGFVFLDHSLYWKYEHYLFFFHLHSHLLTPFYPAFLHHHYCWLSPFHACSAFSSPPPSFSPYSYSTSSSSAYHFLETPPPPTPISAPLST